MTQMIQNYRFGQMKIEGRLYRQDLKIIHGRVVDAWWRSRGHYLGLDDIQDILASGARMVVVGTGAAGAMRLSPDLAQQLADQKIHLIAKPTSEAVTHFNARYAQDPTTAGAFHLTC